MTTNEIFEILQKDCLPFLNLLKNCKRGHFLVRGYWYEIPDIKVFEHNLDGRKPRNMPQEIHDAINDYFNLEFGWKIRNGIFCYGFDLLNNIPIDLGYGKFYAFFPIGDFQYVYSPDHFDLWAYFRLTKGDLKEMITRLKFRNNDFCNVMELQKDFDNFGNEVSVRGRRYYLINTEYATDLSAKIWP